MSKAITLGLCPIQYITSLLFTGIKPILISEVAIWKQHGVMHLVERSDNLLVIQYTLVCSLAECYLHVTVKLIFLPKLFSSNKIRQFPYVGRIKTNRKECVYANSAIYYSKLPLDGISNG